ncbi:MAG: hypothetical protein EA424_28040 [Planctomycetaceae bacterium]|nr:MAG: hypothetical protein EA424_28040 [Planctomycetaceae bacterium]
MLMSRYWKPYVPVARRQNQARQFAAKLAKAGRKLRPIELPGRTIAKTFWGKAWCENLENYSDYANRLPRGRTYVRNGSVIDLQVAPGQVTAIVSGSEMYEVRVEIEKLSQRKWRTITRDCSQSIDSLIDLLQGRFSKGVMARLTRKGDGLFPKPAEIKIACSCPDWAVLCKHVAAVLYGIGARLDEEPELLFTLREVDATELISQAVASENLEQALSGEDTPSLADDDLGALFGIELDQGEAPRTKPTTRAKRKRATTSSAAKSTKLVNKKAKVKKKDPQSVTKTAKKTTKKSANALQPTSKAAKKALPGSTKTAVKKASPKSARKRAKK